MWAMRENRILPKITEFLSIQPKKSAKSAQKLQSAPKNADGENGRPEVQEEKVMQVKVYTPHVVEIASEYIPALAKRAADSLGSRSSEIPATRGHLVRQAVKDGLIRDFDHLIAEDGTVDMVCDPGAEIPLELDGQTLTLRELLEALQYKQNWGEMSQSRGEAA